MGGAVELETVALLGRGWLIGFSIAAPVGPIGLLCIHATLRDGRLRGFVSGLGAATADALYGAVAAFGLTALTRALVAWGPWVHLGGALFLLVLGVRIALQRPRERPADGDSPPPTSLARAYALTFLLTVANPLTVLSFLGIFAGVQAGSQAGSSAQAALLVLGVFVGSATWWAILASFAGLFRERLSARRLRWINVASGLAIIALAVLAAAS